MTRPEAESALQRAREAANDAWQVWAGNRESGASESDCAALGARWRELARAELSARADLDRILRAEELHRSMLAEK